MGADANQSFRRQLHDALSSDFPQLPLPDRRHIPAHELNDNGDTKARAANGYVPAGANGERISDGGIEGERGQAGR